MTKRRKQQAGVQALNEQREQVKVSKRDRRKYIQLTQTLTRGGFLPQVGGVIICQFYWDVRRHNQATAHDM